MEIVIGILLILASVFLITAVLLQQGKSRNLSGAIGGGSSDTYLGRSGSTTLDKKLSTLTTIVAVVFVVLVIIMYLMQDTTNYSGLIKDVDTGVTDTVTGGEDTTPVDDGDVDGSEDTTAEAEA